MDDPLKHEALNGVKLRKKVDLEVESNISDAYLTAKSIKHPWYRCQALAKVAEHANATLAKEALSKSFESAMMCHDENRKVSVACWPIQVALDSGYDSMAKLFLDSCISQLNIDKDPISRWCAVSVLDTIKRDNSLLRYFFNAFKNATREGHGWKVERSINSLIDDAYVQKDQRYIDYLKDRKAGIDEWKKTSKKDKNK